MEASYIKDLHNNYLVLHKEDGSSEEAYCVHMLQANSIDGIIKPKPRIIDSRTLYYYDITSKQPIGTIYINRYINYEQIKKLLLDITSLVEQAYEYLLNENDLVLSPEHIYIELSTGQANLCYLPGNNKDIRKQIGDLVEYLMNKVEYKDKEAVLYVYNLYALCRDEEFSFDNLLLAVEEGKAGPSNKLSNKKGHGQEKEMMDTLDATGNVDEIEPAPMDTNMKRKIPVMLEKVLDEKEEYYYPLRTYVCTGVCVVAAILALVVGINTKLLYNSLGNRIDYGKLMALLLILVCIIGYFMKYIWDKKQRLTKIVGTEEYIDPRIEYKDNVEPGAKAVIKKDIYEYSLPKHNSRAESKLDEKLNSTILLNDKAQAFSCYLEPENKEKYDSIQMKDFPFVIGKLKSNVDYFLDNEVVSRYHVKITKEEDIYYITDLNSTNGTYLNDKPLPCYQRYEIVKDDKVIIAGIRYLFHT